MNRIIKFRAWARDDNPFKKGLMSYNVYPMLNNEIYIDGDIYYVDKFIELMQFTGLHDKNGKEIYEGDILQSYIHPEIELLHKIEWSEKFNGWFAKNLNNKGKDYKTGDIQLWVYIQHNLFEVIGNIYENPELIK